ncbi:hypothetical protein D3C81_1720480 [compost metagenome]
MGERGKHRTAGRNQPNLIAVPDRADGVDQHPALHILLAQEGDQHTHAEVEALQEEKADKQHCDQDKP